MFSLSNELLTKDFSLTSMRSVGIKELLVSRHWNEQHYFFLRREPKVMLSEIKNYGKVKSSKNTSTWKKYGSLYSVWVRII